MEILTLLYHNILVEEEEIVEKKITNEEAEIFFNNTINEVFEKETKKSYKQRASTTEVISIITRVLKDMDSNEELLENIPKRLLKYEISTQKDIDKLGTKIRKGCLLQAYIKKDGKNYFIITKIEATDGLDMTELKMRDILLSSKKIIKSALFEINEAGEFGDIFLSDTNANISKYWYDDFFELEEVTTDEMNNQKTYGIVMKEIKKNIEKTSPSDYTFCRNACIIFFKTKETFDLNDAVNDIFLSYDFENKEIKKEDIIEKIKRKIDKENLDTQFTLKKDVIKNRLTKMRKRVNKEISIEIDGGVENIKDNIYSTEQNGEKYIIIKSTEEETYKFFNWLDNE